MFWVQKKKKVFANREKPTKGTKVVWANNVVTLQDFKV